MALRLQLDPSQIISAAKQAENALEKIANEAIAAEAELKKLGDDGSLQKLKAKFDPTYKAAATLRDELEDLRAAYRGGAISADQYATQLLTMSGGLEAADRASMRSAGSMRMLTQQLSQVGQQTMATGNFVQALAIQLPDIGLAFGAVGTAAGLVAGIALPLVMQAFGSTAAEAKTFDVALNDVLDSLDQVNLMAKANSAEGLADLEARYGRLTTAVRDLIRAQTDLAQVQALNDMQAALSAISDTLGNGAAIDRLASVADIFGMSFQQGVGLTAEAQAANREVAKLALEIDNLSQIDNFSAQADAAAALRQQIVIAAGGVAQMSDAQRQVYQQLVSAEDAARLLAKATGEVADAGMTAADAALAIASNFGTAASSAGGLLSVVARVASEAWSAATAMALWDQPAMQGEDGRGSQRSITQDVGAMRSQQAVRARLAAMSSGGGGGGGSSGGSAANTLSPWFSDDAVRMFQGYADDINAALEEVQNNAQAGAAALSDLFLSAADGADAFSESLSSLLDQLASVALQNALTSLAGMGGTTGTLFAALGASLTPRASGGPVTAGTPYMVGENGPEPFVPAVNGRILSVQQAQAAIGGSASGTPTLVVNVYGASTDADIKRLAYQGASEVVEAYDRQKYANGRQVSGDRRRIS